MFKNETYKLTVMRKDESVNASADHKSMDGSYAVPLFFNEGERGLFVYEIPSNPLYDRWHRIETSVVKLLSVTSSEIIVETENTYYYFTKEFK